jgi:deoxycytidylate deaminase
MKLKTLYSLRNKFTIIGITGKHGGGSSQVARFLSDSNFIKDAAADLQDLNTNIPEDIKVSISYKFLVHENNFKKYVVIDYKSVLLLHLFHESILLTSEGDKAEWKNRAIDKIVEIICQNGKTGNFASSYENRFGEDDNFKEFKQILSEKAKGWFDALSNVSADLNAYLNQNKTDEILNKFYFKFFKEYSDRVFEVLFNVCPIKRSRLLHDLGNNLRQYGTVKNLNRNDGDATFIYKVAESINYLIKSYKSHNDETKVVIDSLKNSLELMYFKEKFSAFYMLSINKDEEDRRKYIARKFEDNQESENFLETFALGETEYLGNDFSKGDFAYPDIENCIQKSEYHVNFKNDREVKKQLIKLLALIEQPGIITPTSAERCMQIAMNAKLNSGCISRQVGAVVTDKDYVIKAVGWNDVAKNQLPCKLRNAYDLVNEKNSDHFSDFEITGEVETGEKKEKFLTLFKQDISRINQENLDGRNCSFCFKTHLNTYEGQKNQVHTRSLHAEENAMMQIAKNGGEGLKEGILFTTASPCELCSKKAYQLGITKIYYVDPYPGIATKHILKSGIKGDYDPDLILFNGAIGNTFHKLYDSFLPYKDEMVIRTDVTPTAPPATEVASMSSVLNRNLKGQEKESFKRFIDERSEGMSGVLELIKLGLQKVEENKSQDAQ